MIATKTYPDTIYESDDAWGEPTFVDDSQTDEIEEQLRECFEVETLTGEWTEWELKTVLPNGNAVYHRQWSVQGDGKWHRKTWHCLLRRAVADDGFFEKIDGGPTDEWSADDE